MKKILFTTLTMILLSTAAYSQFGIKAGFALGEPLDDNTSNMHLGFDLGVTYDITENIRGEVLLESIMRTESFILGDLKSNIMPITAGVQYLFLTDNIQPYIGLNLGLYSLSGKFGNTKVSDTYFGLFPKAGLSVGITENILVDATLKYHAVFNKNDHIDNKNSTIFGANIGLIYKFN